MFKHRPVPDPIKENKKLKRLVVASLITLVIITSFSGYQVYVMNSFLEALEDSFEDFSDSEWIPFVSRLTRRPTEKKVRYDFGDLNKTQKAHVKEVLDDIKPHYLTFQKSMEFTTNLSKTTKTKKGEDCNCDGINYNIGEIYIQYYDSSYILKELVCHEMLHTLFYPVRKQSISDPLHKVIYELGHEQVCFKTPEKKPEIEWLN